MLGLSILAVAKLAFGDPAPPVFVGAGGKRLTGNSKGVYRIPSGAKEVVFDIGDYFATDPDAHYLQRVRYKLEGYDIEWKQKHGEMRMGIRFYDAEEKLIGEQSFTADGKSQGWNGSLDSSTFSHRREIVEVPKQTRGIRLFLSSAGPPTGVGIYAVNGLQVSSVTKDAEIDLEMGGSGRFLKGDGVREVAGWVPEGNLPSMAKVLDIGNPEAPTRSLALIDDSPLSHAEWHQERIIPIRPFPGEKLLLQWNELFDVSDSYPFYVIYKDLPAGDYRFVVNKLDVLGKPSGVETTLEIIVPLPVWRDPKYWAVLGIIFAIAAALIIQRVVKFLVERRTDRLLRERFVELERLRIARDIHDDLGARLTQISLASGMAESLAGTDQDRVRFNELSEMARDLVRAMHETVWTVSPENDTLHALVGFICQSAENLCKPAGLSCRIHVGVFPDGLSVLSETRHNVIMVIKEVVNNVIKHANASELSLNIDLSKFTLGIDIIDDGKGFDPNGGECVKGNGLKNIADRTRLIGGKVFIRSSPGGEGTSVCIEIPMFPSLSTRGRIFSRS